MQLKDSYVEFRDGEAWLVGAHISPYSHGNRENHAAERDRKLLLKRRQIDKLFGRTQIKGTDRDPAVGLPEGQLDQGRDRARPGQEALRQARGGERAELDREAEAAVKGAR